MARRLIVLTAAGALTAALGGGQGASAEPQAQTALEHVRVGDNYFRPRIVRASRGETVRFRWVGRRRHNVTGGGRASRTTSRRGYVYRRRFFRSTRLVCTIHPDSMRMTVRVPR